MSFSATRTAGCLLAILLFSTAARLPAQVKSVQHVTGRAGIVVSDSPPASRIGRQILEEGGNAVDAAVAVAFAMAVSWPDAGNIGGGGFMMVAPAGGSEPMCVEYRETAPAVASKQLYTLGESTRTHRVAGVPGTVRGLALAHERFGRLTWRELVSPAVALARDGFLVHEQLASSLNRVLTDPDVESQVRYEEFRRVFGHPEQRAWRVGDRLVQPDLATTLQLIATEGPDAFYEGRIARQIVAEMRRGGGLISFEDLEGYQAKLRAPIRGTYRGYQIFGPPPPSSGGICVVQMMNVLETFELRQQPRFSARTLHLMTEAMRRAFRDRARYLGDPDYVEIPERLTAKDYARQLAEGITPQRATPSTELAGDIRLTTESDETTHFSVVDRDGMAVSNTYTLEASWGSRIVVRGAGFLLNNEMGDFNWVPGRTDTEGRIGTDANLIAPGKRMLSSQTPVIVKRDGQVHLVVGSPGGRTIINTVVNILISSLEYDMPLTEAIRNERSHHQWFPDQLYFEGSQEKRFAVVIETLKRFGHRVGNRGRQGSAQAIQVDPQHGYIGVADWRRGGLAEAATERKQPARRRALNGEVAEGPLQPGPLANPVQPGDIRRANRVRCAPNGLFRC